MYPHNYNARVRRGREQYGEKFDSSSLDAVDHSIRDAYETGQRVRVSSEHGFTRTGRVSTTMGWRPSFLLMHRSDADGSWDLLGEGDRVIAVWNGRRYVERTNA